MKKNVLIAISLFLAMAQGFAQSEEKETPTITLSGWVNAETFYDTRQTVAARDGEILLYPAEVNKDDNGDDLNGISRWNMLSYMTRARVDASNMEAFGAQTTAKIEVDFLGTANEYVNMVRLRHAFVKMKWDNTQLLLGQYWHPMFVPECFPHVMYQGAAVTMNPLNRSPQVRLTYNLTDKFTVMGAILTQQYHADKQGADVARNSGRPDIQAQIMYKNKTLVAGLTGGYHWIRPEMVTDSGFVSQEILGAYNVNAFMAINAGDITFRLQGNYGQNMHRFVMIGGYGVTEIDLKDGQRTHTNSTTGSIWSELVYAQKSYELGLFGGMTKNFGIGEDVLNNTVYMRSSNIDYAYSIIPRAAIKSGKMKLALEVIYQNAEYGGVNSKYEVENTTSAKNVRFLFSAYRYF